MQQHFLTIQLEVFVQISELIGSKSGRKTGNDFSLQQNTSIFFSGHIDWNFDFTAKIKKIEGAKTVWWNENKKFYKKELSSKFPPKNAYSSDKSGEKMFRQKIWIFSSGLVISFKLISSHRKILFSPTVFSERKENKFHISHETFSGEVGVFLQMSENSSLTFRQKSDSWFFHFKFFSLQKIPNETMEAVLTHVPKVITSRFLFLLNVQILFLVRKIFT